MKRKKLGIILIGILVVGLLSGGASAKTDDFAAIDAISQPVDAIQITQYDDRPEVTLFESMDSNLYVGTYWEGDVLHVIPVPNTIDKLKDDITKATKSRSIGMPQIIIDNKPITRTNQSTYSMADREYAHQYLVENMDELSIQGVGYTADGMAVFMNQGTNDEDKQAVIDASPVKNIEFLEGLFPDDTDDSDIIEDGITSRITATGLRGGNWARRNANGNWSTIAVSAVRNWNGSSGDIGFITCGHGWTDGQKVYGSDGALVGTADVNLYKNMDVTFVKLNNTNLNSHGYMKDGTRITKNGKISNVDINKAIKKYGARTGITSGKVTAVGITGKWSGYQYTNLFMTSCTTRKGDSGCAFIINGNSIVGLMVGARGKSPIVGGTTDDPIYGESVVLPIRDVMNGPGFIPCT